MNVQNAVASPANMAQLTQNIDRLSTRQMTLQGELSSGVVADSYAGLGSQAYTALNLQPQITEVAAWQQNVAAAQSTLNITQTAMSRITTIATRLQTSLTSLQGDQSSVNVTATALEARQSLTELASILNTKGGNGYVFGGNAADTAPVTDPSSILQSNFFTSIAGSVTSLGTASAADVEAATVAAASDNTAGQSVFSSALSVDGNTAAALAHRVAVGDQDAVVTGFVATQGGAASGSSTGSAIRDLMRSLAVVGSLDQPDASSTAFSTLLSDTSTQMATVSSSLSQSVSTLGETQSQLTGRQTTLTQVSDALTTQLGAIKDSDPALLSTQLADAQNQLQASYTLVADMKNMSLADYL